MNKVRGNYIWWWAANLATGILITILGWLLPDIESPFVLGIALIPFGVFKFWYKRGLKPDERERQLLNKVYAESGLVLLIAAWFFSANYFPFGVYSIFSVAFVSRGGYGLYYFLRG
ncbi:MAG: hypothetical protein KAR40_02005 [Candidatus Sabulitectum sp.]|nr:hypothetical protein [Candidatus Sabulitectum sp.]